VILSKRVSKPLHNRQVVQNLAKATRRATPRDGLKVMRSGSLGAHRRLHEPLVISFKMRTANRLISPVCLFSAAPISLAVSLALLVVLAGCSHDTSPRTQAVHADEQAPGGSVVATLPTSQAPHAQPAQLISIQRTTLDQGATLRVFQLEGEFETIPTLADAQTPNQDELRPMIDFTDAGFFELPAPVVTQVRSYLDIVTADQYTFRLTSDDGAILWIGGELVVNHDGRHEATAKVGKPIDLEPGLYALEIDHFDAGHGRRLLLEWSKQDSPGFVPVPPERFLTQRDNARVVAPGVKRVRDDRRPGDGKPVAGVHPSFKLETISVEGFSPMVGAMAFVPDGRLIVGTFDPLQRSDTDLPDIESKVSDKLYALSAVAGDPAKVTIKVAADGLYEPLGLCAVGDDLYVSHRRAITRLRDVDRDGFYETHEDVASGWAAWNYHQFCFGLVHKEGKLYAALSTAMAPPAWEGMMSNAAPNDLLRGSVLEVDLSSNTFSAIAGGVRTPNGLGLGPDGSLFYCDNQGTWMPTNQMAEVVPGRFFGHYNNTNIVPKLAERFPTGGVASIWCDRERAPSTIDLVHNDLCNSPTQPLLIETGPYAGQMLIGELTAGGIRRAFLERINGQWQGAVFQFSQGFSCGVNRLAWGPRGMLMAGGIGAGGNWNWKNTRSGLDRLMPTGVVPFEMLAVRATAVGFEIEFTKPVAANWLAQIAHYEVSQWTYEPTSEYGGEKKLIEKLKVFSAQPSQDGKRVSLSIPNLKQGRTVLLRTDPISVAGEQIWTTQAFYTLNHIPRADTTKIESMGVGALPPANAAVLIGRSAQGAFTVGDQQDPGQGRSQADLLASSSCADVGAGDLVSRASFGDCRLHVEWYCPPGGEGQLAGNSGVYLQDRYEIQILGTPVGSAPLAKNEAAAIYNVKAADVNASTGPGTWQSYDILFHAPRFDRGTKTKEARITLYWNQTLVHDDVALDAPTGAAKAKGESETSNGLQVGPLRLQAHATAAQGPVRFRNVWIAPLEPADSEPKVVGPWQTLSRDGGLEDFVVRGGNATYSIEAGEIVGTSTPNTPNTFLITKQRYDNFELVLEVKQHASLNSGIQIRSTIDAANGGIDNRTGRVRGYQVELDPSDRAFTGGIYDEARRGWLAPLTDNPAARAAFKRDDWNQIRIVAQGPIIRTWVNGVPASTLFDAMDTTGHIGLQVHDVGDVTQPMQVRWRNLRIRTLPGS